MLFELIHVQIDEHAKFENNVFSLHRMSSIYDTTSASANDLALTREPEYSFSTFFSSLGMQRTRLYRATKQDG